MNSILLVIIVTLSLCIIIWGYSIGKLIRLKFYLIKNRIKIKEWYKYNPFENHFRYIQINDIVYKNGVYYFDCLTSSSGKIINLERKLFDEGFIKNLINEKQLKELLYDDINNVKSLFI